MKSVDDAKRDLTIALKYIRFAVEEAQKKGTPQLGILAMHAEGGGKIECIFDSGFIEDVALVLGLPPLSEEDRHHAKAVQFKHILKIRTDVDGK